jgi:hypothetical protein
MPQIVQRVGSPEVLGIGQEDCFCRSAGAGAWLPAKAGKTKQEQGKAPRSFL